MKKIMIGLIVFYRRYLSPLKSTKCPYFPSCSQYGLEAVEQYGVLKGGFLCIWRILRCNPFSQGGYDPVPSINNVHHNKRNIINRRNQNGNEKKLKTFYKF